MNLLEQSQSPTTKVPDVSKGFADANQMGGGGKSIADTYDLNKAAGPAQGPAKLEVDDGMLASKQLESILAKDNPLFEKARARASMGANSRGLLNSSINATAGESAMLDVALPLAQQDANTRFGAAQVNTNASNEFARDANSFSRQGAMARFGHLAGEESADKSRAAQSRENLLERENRTMLQINSQDFQATQNKLNQQFQMDFEKFRLPQNMMATFQERMQDYVTQVMRDPNMDAAAKDQAIKNYYAYSQQTMGWMSNYFGSAMPDMTTGGKIMPAGQEPVQGPSIPQPTVGVPVGGDVGVPRPRNEPVAPIYQTTGANAGQRDLAAEEAALRYQGWTGDQFERFNRPVVQR
jgi:hypothetical protein